MILMDAAGKCFKYPLFAHVPPLCSSSSELQDVLHRKLLIQMDNCVNLFSTSPGVTTPPPRESFRPLKDYSNIQHPPFKPAPARGNGGSSPMGGVQGGRGGAPNQLSPRVLFQGEREEGLRNRPGGSSNENSPSFYPPPPKLPRTDAGNMETKV